MTLETVCEKVGQQYDLDPGALQYAFTKIWAELSESDKRPNIQEAMTLLEDVFSI